MKARVRQIIKDSDKAVLIERAYEDLPVLPQGTIFVEGERDIGVISKVEYYANDNTLVYYLGNIEASKETGLLTIDDLVNYAVAAGFVVAREREYYKSPHALPEA